MRGFIAAISLIFMGGVLAVVWGQSSDAETNESVLVLKRPLTNLQTVQSVEVKPYQLKKLKTIQPKWQSVKKTIDDDRLGSLLDMNKIARSQRPAIAVVAVPGKGLKLAQALPQYVERTRKIEAPVLLPMEAFKAKRTNLVTGKNFFDFNAEFDKKNVTMMGMCQEADLPQSSPAKQAVARRRARETSDTDKKLKVLGTPYQISRQESGFGLRFSKFGCAYKLDCDTCETEEEMVLMAEKMGVINAR